MEERRSLRLVPRNDLPADRNQPRKPKRWLAHPGHDRTEDRRGPHFRVSSGPNR